MHTNIEEIAGIIADETQYRDGFRDPRSPGFVYFDDERELDTDISWGRNLALDFEEWVALQNHHEALDNQREALASRKVIAIKSSPTRPSAVTSPESYKHLPKAARKRVEALLAIKVDQTVSDGGSYPDVTSDYEPMEGDPAVYRLCTYSNLFQVVNNEYNRLHPVRDEHGVVNNPYDPSMELVIARATKEQPEPITMADKAAVEEAQRLNNWTIGWHKRRPQNNDHWRKLVAPLSAHLDNPDCLSILKTLREALPFAQGPLAGTVFINPDGTRWESSDTNGGKAKEAYAKRHKVPGHLITMDRTQLEDKKVSKWVIGRRRSSEDTPSNWYDPNPSFVERKQKDEWVREYDSLGNNLYAVPESRVFEGHRLTVREFERAIIAGAETFDDEDDVAVARLEADFLPDSRVLLLNMGYGCNGRDESALSHEEAYLYGVLRMFGLEEACEIMLLEQQEPGLLAAHLMKNGNYSENLVSILKWVSTQDKPSRNAQGRAQPPVNDEPMLAYVISALTDRPLADIEDRLDTKSVSRDNVHILEEAQKAQDAFIRTRSNLVTRAWHSMTQEERALARPGR